MKNNTLIVITGLLAIILVCVFLNTDMIAYYKINPNNYDISEYEDFLEKYPDSKYADGAFDQVYLMTKESNSTAMYERFIKRYPNSKYTTDANDNLWDIVKAKNSISEFDRYATKYPSTEYGKEAREITNIQCHILYSSAESKNTIDAWNDYKGSVPSSYHKDADERIKTIKNEPWSTDYKAWNQANRENTIAAFSKYLELYPNGRYKSGADKKIIDIEVADVFANDHGILPAMNKIGLGTGGSSTVNIYNNTSYILTLRYSGPTSKKIIILSQQRKTLTINSGNYKIAASVNASNVRNFAGNETLSGGNYEVEYYIKTQRY